MRCVQILYSINDGVAYTHLITNNLSSSERSFPWLIPNLDNSTIRLKILAKNASGSLTIFQVIGPGYILVVNIDG